MASSSDANLNRQLRQGQSDRIGQQGPGQGNGRQDVTWYRLDAERRTGRPVRDEHHPETERRSDPPPLREEIRTMQQQRSSQGIDLIAHAIQTSPGLDALLLSKRDQCIEGSELYKDYSTASLIAKTIINKDHRNNPHYVTSIEWVGAPKTGRHLQVFNLIQESLQEQQQLDQYPPYLPQQPGGYQQQLDQYPPYLPQQPGGYQQLGHNAQHDYNAQTDTAIKREKNDIETLHRIRTKNAIRSKRKRWEDTIEKGNNAKEGSKARKKAYEAQTKLTKLNNAEGTDNEAEAIGYKTRGDDNIKALHIRRTKDAIRSSRYRWEKTIEEGKNAKEGSRARKNADEEQTKLTKLNNAEGTDNEAEAIGYKTRGDDDNKDQTSLN